VIPFIIAGLVSGSIYALAGTGLVLTYRTSGVLNFAHGALAAVAAYMFYALYVLNRWSWPAAAAVTILAAGPAMGLVMERIARTLDGASLTLKVVSSIGLLIAIEAAVQLIYGLSQTTLVPVFLGQATHYIGGVYVQTAQIVTFVFAIAATGGLALVVKCTRLGKAMRAVVDDPDLLRMTGTSATATRRAAWVIGAVLVSASGVLFAPLLPLDPVQLTLLVVSAFGAAALGRFKSLPFTALGGFAIGILASLATKWFTSGILAGIPPAFPFVVLFVVLIVLPRRYVPGAAFTAATAPSTLRVPRVIRIIAVILALAALALAPAYDGLHSADWTAFVAMAIVFMSLSLLVRASGQISLAHVAFAAIGACAFSHFTINEGLPWFVALIASAAVAMPIGALLAIPAIRLGGLYLAMATFGFGILVQSMFYSQTFMFGPTNGALTEPRPHLSWLAIGSDTGYYYLVLAIAAVVGITMIALDRGRLGRLTRAMAQSPRAVETSGVSITVTRVLVFVVCAGLAAVGGALAAVAYTSTSAMSYPPLLSLTWFALIVIVVGRAPWDAALASACVTLVPSYVTGGQVTTVSQLVFGVAAVAYAMLRADWGRLLPSRARRALESRSVPPGRRTSAETARSPKVHMVLHESAELLAPGRELEIRNLSVRFGGNHAIDDVSLRVAEGKIVALVGPNGAGKTTTFNACSGYVRPLSGDIMLNGRSVSRAGRAARARHGLGRTFQTIELMEALTVRENVELGAEGTLAGSNPLRHIVGRRSDHGRIEAAVDRALDLCDLRALESRRASELSTGHRRLVEVARCLAGTFNIVLLDEPSSGLGPGESQQLAAILRRVVEERNVGILLIEHDMSMALGLADHVYVLDFGRLIFEGSATEFGRSSVVRSAYLGDVDVVSLDDNGVAAGVLGK
jgi:ABC-type branched-subunit amino acid transport system ATPase component/branched-subunit amino acid ABC-type transport system permease component